MNIIQTTDKLPNASAVVSVDGLNLVHCICIMSALIAFHHTYFESIVRFPRVVGELLPSSRPFELLGFGCALEMAARACLASGPQLAWYFCAVLVGVVLSGRRASYTSSQ